VSINIADGSEPLKAQWGFTISKIHFYIKKYVSLFCMRYTYRQKLELTFYDIGGDEKFRKIWTEYYADVMGCIYVVDASNAERFAESKEALHSMFFHEFMVGKPVLMYVSC
jgi:GTPase SAR1 family protein